MDKNEKILLAELLEEQDRRQREAKFRGLFPDKGEYRRELYKKHMEFLSAGAEFKERAFIAANRVGKSQTGAYEVTCHATGLYPDWWKGKVFNEPTKIWAIGKSTEATANVIQEILYGDFNDPGTGMIPKDRLLVEQCRRWPGVTGVIRDMYVKHVSGGVSHIQFKNMEQAVGTFMGTGKHVIWIDEECESKMIYDECLTRTMTTDGIVFTTFTPLAGLTDIVLSFLNGGKFPEDGITKDDDGNPLSKFIVNCDWDDVPHLNDKDKKILLSSYLPHQRDARSKGLPVLGSGAIYPVSEDFIKVDPFAIPPDWPRAYGMDFGWNCTACIWGAKDPNTGIIYLYSEYAQGKREPEKHAQIIKAKGDWIIGAADPAGGGHSQMDGRQFINVYYEEGLNLISGNNSVEPGLAKTLGLFESGQLKVFSNLSTFFDEYRLYRRDDDGKIIKKNDHVMDALRYLIMSFDDIAQELPDVDEEDFYSRDRDSRTRNPVTGY